MMHLSVTRIKKNPTQVSRPTAIDGALYLARDTAPHLAGLADFLTPRLPRMPNASPNIRSFTRARYSDPTQLAVAIHQPWMALDSMQMRNVLAVDIDHGDGTERAEEVARLYRLPRPTVIADPWSGRSHAVWVLGSPVCMSSAARQGPQILADLACRLLAAAMGGTALPAHSLLKSPWGLEERLQGRLMHRGPAPSAPVIWEAHESADLGLLWHTVPGDLRALELREVVAALAGDFGELVAAPSTRKLFRRKRGEPSSLGRNYTMFDLVRWWSYDRHETDAAAIQAEADRINSTFSDPLPASEVAATARSIGRFMVSRYRPRTGAGNTRGRDRLQGAGLDASARQALAGKKTAAARAGGTDAKISSGLRKLIEDDIGLTQEALTGAAGVSLRTVKARWHEQTMVQDAALSGSGAAAARLVPYLSSTTLTLSDLAQADRTERQVRTILAQLDAATAAAKKPGASPLPVPEIPAALSRLPIVRAALRRAQDAQADATRRAADRAAKAAAAERAAEMRTQAALGTDGWRWWRQQLADLDAVWDAVESEAAERERPFVRAKREAVFAARWRQWNAARRAVARRGPAPARPRRQAADVLAAIPW